MSMACVVLTREYRSSSEVS